MTRPAAAPQIQAWYLEMIRQANEHGTELTLDERLAARLGGKLWSRCRREWRTTTCRSLDRVARRLEAEASPEPVTLSELVRTRRWLGWMGVDFGGRGLVAGLIRAVLRDDPATPEQAAFQLRIYGVAVCYVRYDLLGFEHCACAVALAASTSAAAIGEALSTLPDL